MENLIKIEPHKDSEGKDCLKVSLTIDGAHLLYRDGLTINDLWDNEPDKDGLKILFSPAGAELKFAGETIIITGHTIYSNVFILQDNMMHVIKVHQTKELADQSLIEKWRDNPAYEAIYYPKEDNAERMAKITAKLAANQWATYSDEKLDIVILEINARWQILKRANEKVIEAYQTLNYKKYKQDDKYFDMLEPVKKEKEKEIDYCFEKMNIIRIISNGNYNITDTISKVYKKYRGVVS